MVSQRIEDALEVLALMREYYHRGASRSVSPLRIDAVEIVARRGVDQKTVHAHVVGKDTAHTLPTREFDRLAQDWLDGKSDALETWYLRSTKNSDTHHRIRDFFQTDAGSTPKAADLSEPELTQHVPVITYRILRDTVLARRVKVEQDYKCQLCGFTLILGDGRPYAEAHHVKPLGRGHSGPDVRENILCVCPNCHVMLDYGVVYLNHSDVPSVLSKYVDYHNGEIVSAS